MMTRFENEPQIAAIAQRLRDFLLRQPGFSAPTFALSAGISDRRLRDALAPGLGLIDPAVLIDAIAAVVQQYGVDVHWLLTGEYDPAAHRAFEQAPVRRSDLRQLVAAQLPNWVPSRTAVRVLA